MAGRGAGRDGAAALVPGERRFLVGFPPGPGGSAYRSDGRGGPNLNEMGHSKVSGVSARSLGGGLSWVESSGSSLDRGEYRRGWPRGSAAFLRRLRACLHRIYGRMAAILIRSPRSARRALRRTLARPPRTGIDARVDGPCAPPADLPAAPVDACAHVYVQLVVRKARWTYSMDLLSHDNRYVHARTEATTRPRNGKSPATRGFPYAPERTRTSTDHSVHKALNLARLPIPPQARQPGKYRYTTMSCSAATAMRKTEGRGISASVRAED